MINASTKADQTYTVDQFIEMQSSDETTYYNYSILDHSNGFDYSITNILYDYQDELEENSVIVKLSDLEFLEYRYRPWLFAYKIYKSEETDFIIKTLNGILSDNEFDFKRIRMLTPQAMSTLLGRIYSANSVFINNNRSTIDNIKKKENKANPVW